MSPVSCFVVGLADFVFDLRREHAQELLAHDTVLLADFGALNQTALDHTHQRTLADLEKPLGLVRGVDRLLLNVHSLYIISNRLVQVNTIHHMSGHNIQNSPNSFLGIVLWFFCDNALIRSLQTQAGTHDIKRDDKREQERVLKIEKIHDRFGPAQGQEHVVHGNDPSGGMNIIRQC